MTFTDQEVAYLSAQPIARFATVGPEEQPDVVPVAVEFDGTFFWVGGTGQTVLATRKMRNVRGGRSKVALVFDDIVSVEPFVARSLRVYGVADGPFERSGMVGPGHFLRIAPTVSWSWNLDGEPVGDTWYEARRTVHG
ncbi:PPOX class F420-dependent oxidoreductase [Cryptosporangium minutisporangium]|uniref:Pyridoxamine 5'-phosphate oxidase N-terminal domain-containing protein n=1 Tax=Cryptosporangium minutisporangium TaxID=113569 RepID=A0ABP6T6A7_9ACTN